MSRTKERGAMLSVTFWKGVGVIMMMMVMMMMMTNMVSVVMLPQWWAPHDNYDLPYLWHQKPHIFLHGHINECVYMKPPRIKSWGSWWSFFPSMLIELDRYPPLVCPGWTSIPASPSSRNPPKNPDSSDSPPHCQVTCSAPGGGKALVTWKSWVSEFAFAQRECLFFLNSCDWDLLWQEVRMLEILCERTLWVEHGSTW